MHRPGFVRSADGRGFAAAALASVLPVWVAAWRVASSGLVPTGDAALTVLQARNVFSGAFPLVGMPAASATSGHVASHFPGALQLYVLAVPVRLFGNVWGPPIAMAALSTMWIVLVAWALYRSFGPRQGVAGLALLAVFTWSVGVGHLVDPVPIAMIVFPLVPLLIVAWCATSGEPVALAATAAIGMFLWLDHLVLVVVVPPVVLGAFVGYVAAHRGVWRDRSGTGRGDRRRALRGVFAAASISAILWLPTVIGEIVRSPGNLHLLVVNSGTGRDVIGSWTFAVHVVVGLIAWPPFWLRGSFSNAPFHNVPGGAVFAGAPRGFDIIVAIVLVVLFVVLGVTAARRGDRRSQWGLVIAAIGAVAALPTIFFTPTRFGIAGYLRPLWGIAAFVWLVVLLAAYRVVVVHRHGDRLREPLRWSAVAVAIAFGLLNLPTSGRGYVPDVERTRRARVVDRRLVEMATEHGPLALRTRPDYDTQSYFGAAVLALRTAGVDFCVAAGSGPIDGVPACGDIPRREVAIRVVRGDERPSGTILEVPLLDTPTRERYRRLDTAVSDWLSGDDPPVLSGYVHRAIDEITDPVSRSDAEELLVVADDSRPLDDRRRALRMLVGLWFSSSAHSGEPLFESSPLTVGDLRAWQQLGGRDRSLVLVDRGATDR